MSKRTAEFIQVDPQPFSIALRENGQLVKIITADNLNEGQAIIDAWLSGTYQLLID